LLTTVDRSDPVLIYDDDCPFCRRWVARFERWNRHQTVKPIPLHDPWAATVSGKTPAELARAMHFVAADGRVFAGAGAVQELLRFVPWGWLPRATFGLPGVMSAAERIYGFVAARRVRGGCGGKHCETGMAQPAEHG
jgi:predicted DCC family thiol-disulfide oxidoreductase YuxK